LDSAVVADELPEVPEFGLDVAELDSAVPELGLDVPELESVVPELVLPVLLLGLEVLL
jgi:hypothetical protein